MNAPLECIIQKYEKSTVDWKKGMSGKRSVIFREQDFKETGKRDFMNQLMELEMEGLVKVKWYQYGIEAEKAWYSLEQMETIYQRLGKIPKFKRINKLKEEVDQQLASGYAAITNPFSKVWIKEMFPKHWIPQNGNCCLLVSRP